MHALILTAALLLHQNPAWGDAPSLPRPVANNAVAAVVTETGPAVFSFLGMDTTRAWDGVTSAAFRWNTGADQWTEVRPVPGPGRLAATAQAINGTVFVFGGYTVAEDGSERSLPNVDIYHPATDTWTRGADMPMPVDDAVSGVWRDSLVFLVSGWHDTGNVDRVQIYDPATDSWQQGTPIPGTPVFGHAGALAGDTFVYLGGARVTDGTPRYTIEPGVWRGDIDPADPTRVRWRPLEPPPGPPLYRAAGVAVGGRIVFGGGTDNPYNYDGIGYNGVPAEPRSDVFAYEVAADEWVELPSLAIATMDHRNLVVADGQLLLIGGMTAAQTVSDRVTTFGLDARSPTAGGRR